MVAVSSLMHVAKQAFRRSRSITYRISMCGCNFIQRKHEKLRFAFLPWIEMLAVSSLTYRSKRFFSKRRQEFTSQQPRHETSRWKSKIRVPSWSGKKVKCQPSCNWRGTHRFAFHRTPQKKGDNIGLLLTVGWFAFAPWVEKPDNVLSRILDLVQCTEFRALLSKFRRWPFSIQCQAKTVEPTNA